VVTDMKGKGLLEGLWITLRHLFEREITIQYPEQMPYLQERFRGCLQFDYKKCIVCGLCTKACPNNVLSYESEPAPNSKKKILISYTIDLQYCMFCNLCVEACPTGTLYFNHNFELSEYQRDDIKIVYEIPRSAQAVISEPIDSPIEMVDSASEPVPQPDEEEAKKQKQINAMITALQKNPVKAVSKLVESEVQAQILADILQADEKKLVRMATMMIEDREKAGKVALAFVNKELKDRQQEGGAGNEPE